MEQKRFIIAENRALNASVYRLRLRGEGPVRAQPGQFAQVKLEGFFLRRPFSVCDCEGETLTLVYKTVGQGTRALSRMRPGEELELLCGLGSGFDMSRAGERPLLIGGGLGLTPLILLARRLAEAGSRPAAVLGFNTAAEAVCEEAFRALGCSVTVATADGSYGVPGLVTDALPEGADFFYACGPEAMLRALCAATELPGQVSLEARMGCGFGACMGCTIETASGPKRVCREGPVFDRRELLW